MAGETGPRFQARPVVSRLQVTPGQRCIIRGLKELEAFDGPFLIPIVDGSGNRLGALQPVTKKMAEDAYVVELLTKWRAMFMKYFLTQFQATEQRTKRWLEDIV